MKNCYLCQSCGKKVCDLACSRFAETEHWSNRCKISTESSCVSASLNEACLALNSIESARAPKIELDSSFRNLSVINYKSPKLMADLISYLCIVKYCANQGLYGGVYKLDLSEYLADVKNSWASKYGSTDLDDCNVWIESSTYLVIYNLTYVRFGDYESQTLLSILQRRNTHNKYTIVVLDSGQIKISGKPESLFYQKLRDELTVRGAKL